MNEVVLCEVVEVARIVLVTPAAARPVYRAVSRSAEAECGLCAGDGHLKGCEQMVRWCDYEEGGLDAPYHEFRNGSERLHNEFLICICDSGILLKHIVQVLELL